MMATEDPESFINILPESKMNVPEMIRYHGYPCQIVTVTTADGYILEMHRIPWGKTKQSGMPPSAIKPVIFMQHGLEASSDNWVDNLPPESFAFIAADAGFDVWLGNMRGNTYGKAHVAFDPSEAEFWKFSWDEMVKYDLDAMIDEVLKQTNHESLYYVGHSQGTLTMFCKLATDPAFAKKIKKFFALAPVGTVKYLDGLLKFLATMLTPSITIDPKGLIRRLGQIFNLFGNGEFFPTTWLTKLTVNAVCSTTLGNGACNNMIFLLGGPDSNQFNKARVSVYTSHNPAGTSTQNILHWVQMVVTGETRMYDHGTAEANQKLYGSSTPPAYDFTKIQVPMYLYWSPGDWMADQKDVEGFLLPSLNPQYLIQNNRLEDFNHMDFIWGMRAPKLIYEPIMQIIRKDLVIVPLKT